MNNSRDSLSLEFEIAYSSFDFQQIENEIKIFKRNLTKKNIVLSDDLIIKNNKLSCRYEIKLISKTAAIDELIKSLDQVKNIILYNLGLKDKIVIIKDEANNYMCNILYPEIMDIETRLRGLINIIYMQLSGDKWKKEIDEKTKQLSNKQTRISNLDEIFLDTLTRIVFDININESNQIPNNLQGLTKTELINFINDNKKITFWEKFFPTIKVQKEDICSIRNIRNKVMHFKPIPYSVYKTNLKVCNKIKTALDKAYLKVQGIKLSTYKEFSKSINKIASEILTFQQNMRQLSNSIEPVLDLLHNFKTYEDIWIKKLNQKV